MILWRVVHIPGGHETPNDDHIIASDVQEYYSNIVSATENYLDAGRRMVEMGDHFIAQLADRRNYSRSLYTTAHNEELGPLEQHLHALETMLAKIQRAQRGMLSGLGAGVDALKSFADADLRDTDPLSREVWKLGDVYEAALLKTLHDVASLQGRHADSLHDARACFELARFDMVQ